MTTRPSQSPLTDIAVKVEPSPPASASQHRGIQRQYQQQPQTQCSRAPIYASIPASDPQKTRILWAAVSAAKSQIQGMGDHQPRAGGRPKGRGAGQQGARNKRGDLLRDTLQPSGSEQTLHAAASGPRSAAEVPTLSSELEDSLNRTTIPSTGTKSIRPENKRYEELVLQPRHIHINAEQGPPVNSTPYKHFATAKPSESSHGMVQSLEGARVGIAFDEEGIEAISREYRFMNLHHLCEEEFASYAKETFFRGEPRQIEPAKDRHWRAERMIQFVCPTSKAQLWCTPPVLDSPETLVADDSRWDVRPDCAYWLSLRGFNDDWSRHICRVCFVHQNWITCSYLTIEFKRQDNQDYVARRQAAAASAMALYNRYVLHVEAQQAQQSQNLDTDKLKHYIVTFAAAAWAVWVMQPRYASKEPSAAMEEWNGCEMHLLISGDCQSPYSVHDLVDWINGIHSWGLSRHANACQTDIKRILQANEVDTSTIEE